MISIESARQKCEEQIESLNKAWILVGVKLKTQSKYNKTILFHEFLSYSVQLRPGSRIQQRKTMNLITLHHKNLMGVVNYQFT